MASLRISCFGEFQAELDGKPIQNFFTDKARALLAYLAVERARPHTRAHLAGLLWSDQPDEQALHNLRQTLTYLRKALGEGTASSALLLVERDTIRLNPAAQVWLDVRAFEEGLRRASRPERNGDGWRWLNPQRLSDALALYRGPFLDQLVLEGSPLFDEWSSLLREQLNHRCVEGLALMADYHERQGETALARQALSRLLSLTPWEETAHAQMMRLLAQDGQRSAAQSQYVLLRRYLREHLGLEPSSHTTALFEAIRSGSPVEALYPPARHNLPPPGPSFVGRQPELSELLDSAIDPGCRMLTLLGPGGAGKTSLALETARRLVGIFPGGVYYAPLRAVSQAGELAAALAEALDCNFSERQPPAAQLCDFLRRKNLLLVLDNFEQLLPDAGSTALLAEILAEAPQVKLIVTSRERLNLREECIFPVEGLRFPDGADLPGSPEDYEALALFQRRARQVKRRFQLEGENLAAAVKICRLVDGLPLAIELAAATLWNRSCPELAATVQHDLDALQDTSVNAPQHHSSLRAVFEVSWGLLEPEEQQTLARLAVFRGGFNKQAALEAAGATAELLDELVGHSLLRRGADGRYDLHEVLRQYASEKLQEMPGEAQAMRARHADYFSRLLAAMRTAIKGKGQADVLVSLQCELENAHLAWQWLASSRSGDGLASCAESLYQFFNIRSRFAEGIAWFQAGAAALEGLPTESLALAKLLSRQGALAHRLRQVELAGQALERSRTILSGLGQDHHSELAFCLVSLGNVLLRRKEFEAALDCARQSLELYRREGSLDGQAYALSLQGLIYNRMGNFQQARRLLEESIRAARKAGNPRRAITPLNLLGDIACNQGDYAAAEHYFEEGVEVSRRLNDVYNLGILVNNLATVFHLTQRYEQARVVYEESLALCREQGDRDGEALTLNNMGELAAVGGDYQRALALSRQALAIAEELGEEWTIIACLNSLGEAACANGELGLAEGYLRRGIEMAMQISSPDLAARLVVNLAPVFHRQGEQQAAIELLQAALANSATEQNEREKAAHLLAEVSASAAVVDDDSLLEEVVVRHVLSKQ